MFELVAKFIDGSNYFECVHRILSMFYSKDVSYFRKQQIEQCFQMFVLFAVNSTSCKR